MQRGGQVLGFSITGPSREAEDGPSTGEVYAIYLDPDRITTGLGRRLFAYSLMALGRLGFREVVVWVLRENERARRFYEAAGCILDPGGKTIAIGGADLREVCYRRALS